MTEVVKCAVNTRSLPFPLRIGFGGKVEWNLADSLRKSHGKFAPGVIVAEQHISDCGAALCPRKPSLDNRRDVLVSPIDTQRTAVEQNYHSRFTCSIHRLQQLQLAARQVEAGAAHAFADSFFRVSEHNNDHL